MKVTVNKNNPFSKACVSRQLSVGRTAGREVVELVVVKGTAAVVIVVLAAVII